MGNNKFEEAIQHVLWHEGGYQADPGDPGNWVDGELRGTKYGIAARFFPDEDIEGLTVERAKEIYQREYWDKSICEQLPERIAAAYFDAIVNMGLRRASKVLQRTINRVFGDDYLVVDGIVGPLTKEALGALLSWMPYENFVRMFTIERIRDYVYGRDATKAELLSWLKRTLYYETEAKLQSQRLQMDDSG